MFCENCYDYNCLSFYRVLCAVEEEKIILFDLPLMYANYF